MKQIKRFQILDTTKEDTAIAFWFEDGTKEIQVLSKAAVKQLVNEGKQILEKE